MKMLKLLLCGPALLLATGVMHADTVFSENFNTVYGGFSLSTAGQFSAAPGTNIDVLGPFGDANAQAYQGLCSGPESGNCVDLGGTATSGANGNPQGNIELTTSLNLAAGTYLLSFDLLGSQRGVSTSTQVNFGPYSQTFNLNSSDVDVVSELVTVTGGPTQLQFIELAPPGNVGAVLDNITIASTPEPSSLALLATGLLGSAGMIRRKFKA
jgi:hypothetical protein